MSRVRIPLSLLKNKTEDDSSVLFFIRLSVIRIRRRRGSPAGTRLLASGGRRLATTEPAGENSNPPLLRKCIAIRSTFAILILSNKEREVIIMKNSTVSVRVEDNIKSEAEEIMQKLGIPVSVVINSLYRQIIYTHGIPFSLTIPSEPKTLENLSDEELVKKLEHSHMQAQRREGRSLDEVFSDLERGIN